MAFFNYIKRAFGLGPDYDEVDDNEVIGQDATVIPLSMREQRTNDSDRPDGAMRSETTEADNTEETVTNAETIPVDMIFEHVVATFNGALPAFLAGSIDADKQRRILYDALSDDIKRHIENAGRDVERSSSAKWNRERRRMQTNIDDLKEQAKKVGALEEDLKRSNLSLERQRRAMNDRIADLERLLQEKQAENEQLDLENKSLVNKLRVSAVQLGIDISELPAPAVDAEIAAELETLREANKSLSADVDQLKTRAELADTMINKLNQTAASLREQVEEKDAALAEASKSLEMLEVISEQVDRFEEVKQRKDQRIKELQDERTGLLERIRSLENETRSLKQKAEEASSETSLNETVLQEEIDHLKAYIAELEANNTTESETPTIAAEPISPLQSVNETKSQDESFVRKEEKGSGKKRRKKTPVISAIDDSLDNIDWLVSTPPESSVKKVKDDVVDFGYQPPKTKRTPPNDAQMSLW